MNTKILFIVVLGIIIILLLVIVLFFGSNNQKPTPSGDSSGLIIGNNAIYVADQIPGQSVSVQVVRLEKSGFVVIHEDNNGMPGKILGVSSLLAPGEIKDLPPITLSRATHDGETLYAMIHVDNGDGKFDDASDKPSLDPVGNMPVMMIFTVTKDATEPKAINL